MLVNRVLSTHDGQTKQQRVSLFKIMIPNFDSFLGWCPCVSTPIIREDATTFDVNSSAAEAKRR